jgi:hypothetical protein
MKRYYKGFLRPSQFVATSHPDAQNRYLFAAESIRVLQLVATVMAMVEVGCDATSDRH